MKITAATLNDQIIVDGVLILNKTDGTYWAPTTCSAQGLPKLALTRAELIERLGTAVRMRHFLDSAIANMEALVNTGERDYDPYVPTHVHKPTSKPCSIMQREGARAFCNFGDAANPFTWVDVADLLRIEQPQPLGPPLSNPHEQNPGAEPCEHSRHGYDTVDGVRRCHECGTVLA